MTTRSTQPLPAITEDTTDDGWNLGDESATDAANESKLVIVPRLATPVNDEADGFALATARTMKLPKPVLGTPLPARKAPKASEQDVKPAYWSELKLPQPISEIAQGTQPEEDEGSTAAPDSVPVFWHGHSPAPVQTPAADVEPDLDTIDEAFTEADRAFFAEGEQLSKKKQTVDEFVDMADRTLSFWQRFWKR